MAIKMNEDEIRKTIAILKPEGQLFEVRAIDGRWNTSGYFTSADTLIEELKTARIRRTANIYITLNDIKQACYSRKQRDCFIEYAAPTTTDTDIDGYDWLMIDLDPKRASGTSSSDEELKKAKQKANDIYAFLRNKGWNEPVIALSGNGIHLLYKLQMLNDDKRKEKIKGCLKVLDMLFSDESIDIDTATFNPARVCKLYGTMASKGSDSPERPHRMSYIHRAPAEVKYNDIKFIDRLLELLPCSEEPEKANNYNPQSFDLQSWINEHGLKVKEKTKWNGGIKWILDECPFDSSHKGKDAAIVQTTDGKICFNCFHNSCSHNHWKELRLKFEPNAYDKKYLDSNIKPNHKNPNYVVEKTTEVKSIDGKPVFYTTEQIRLLETPPEEFIKTGITEIDNKLRGLKKGFVTCLSGLRACGKSSIISQLSIEAARQEYRTALFSGELTAKNTYKWLMLQGAGKNFVEPTQFENYYVVQSEIEEQISKWLDEKVYIYNNEYGNEFEELLYSLEKCVINHKVDLIILDNLMAINTSRLDYDKYQQQSKFVDNLEQFAKRCNVHILFVAHPRKSQGFLRLDDVSGSNDIVNRVDNAFILHRVNNDFKRLSSQMFGWKKDNTLFECDNVIEICKDRDGGVQDYFIPLWFEKESKRLKNRTSENKVYLELESSDIPFE